MLKFQWNALRKGDKVFVHGPARMELTLSPGVVELTEMRKPISGVGIRMATRSGASPVVWPSYLAVHMDPIDPNDPCWRCRALADLDERRRR